MVNENKQPESTNTNGANAQGEKTLNVSQVIANLPAILNILQSHVTLCSCVYRMEDYLAKSEKDGLTAKECEAHRDFANVCQNDIKEAQRLITLIAPCFVKKEDAKKEGAAE